MYYEYVLEKRKSNNFEPAPKDCSIPFVSSVNDDILKLVFAPDPTSGVPVSDLVLMSVNNLAPAVFDFISKLTQQHVTSINTPFSKDQEAFDSIIPYFLDNETQIMQFYKARGFDTERIEALLSGDSLDSLPDSSDSSSSDSE